MERPPSLRPGLSVDPVEWHLARSERRAYLDGVSARLNDAGLSVTAELLEGRPADRIIEYAQAQQVELIVLSSHGNGGLTDWPVSSTTQKVIVRSSSSALLIRAGRPGVADVQGVRYNRVMVPLDGSWRAETALPAATVLAQYHHAMLVLARVVNPPEMARRTPVTDDEAKLIAQVTESNQSEAVNYLDQLQSRLPFESSARVLTGGNVLCELHQLIRQDDIDLTVLSAHGFSGRVEWPYGGVALNLIAYSMAPTLIVQDSPTKPNVSAAEAAAASPREAPVHAAPSNP